MRPVTAKYSGILLAGGKSSRMGTDKAFIKYANRYLYEYPLSVLSFFSGDLLVSSSNPRFFNQHFRVISDHIQGIGPIGGLYSCLKNIKNQNAIVLPCDLPFVGSNIIESLIKNTGAAEITVALNKQNLPEPLIGIYSASIVPVMEKMIGSGEYRMHKLFNLVKTNFVDIPDASPESFLNINNHDDFNVLP